MFCPFVFIRVGISKHLETVRYASLTHPTILAIDISIRTFRTVVPDVPAERLHHKRLMTYQFWSFVQMKEPD